MEGVDYSQPGTPPEYVCGECGRAGVKMWHMYHGRALRCVTHKRRGDVPAVPDEEGAGFWKQSEVPQAGFEWWRKLPNGL